ncbi:MAG: hypothetical protein D6731_25050 [Planctomycetota bacterium]|nr:MAG: hypothetical protein D6731_25050 [Planctomycetota bacterium]
MSPADSAPGRDRSGRSVGLAFLAYSFYAAHATYFLWVGRPENLLWGCHLAVLGVGTGLLLRVPLFAGMGMISLLWGVPLWLLDVFTGGEFLPTSVLTHVGGALLGLVALRRLGIPRGTWWVLWATTVGLVFFSRLFSRLHENVNLCWGPPPGWDALPGYPTFGALLFGGAALTFWACERLLRRLVRARAWDARGEPALMPAFVRSARAGATPAGSPRGSAPTDTTR